MQLGRCPVCHHRIDLEALVQDEAGSKLLGLLARQPREVAVPLIQYLGLFRPAKQDLSNVRALKLVQEVVAMATGGPLAAALEKTVENILRQRANQSNNKPLPNHNYLKQVLETLGNPITRQGYQKQADPPGKQQGDAIKDQLKKPAPDEFKDLASSLGVKVKG